MEAIVIETDCVVSAEIIGLFDLWVFSESESASFEAWWKYFQCVVLDAEAHIDWRVINALECDEAISFQGVTYVLCKAWYVGVDRSVSPEV